MLNRGILGGNFQVLPLNLVRFILCFNFLVQITSCEFLALAAYMPKDRRGVIGQGTLNLRLRAVLRVKLNHS